MLKLLSPILFFYLTLTVTAFAYERKPLTYRDWGLYCGPVYHIPESKRTAGWDYYDPHFINNDSPWDFFIIQVNKYTGEGSEAANRELNKIIDGLHKRKKHAILRILLFKKNQKAKNIEFYKKKIDAFFEAIDINKIYAVIIDEENIYWNGYGDVLEPIYDYIKSKHPELPAFQFYTPMVTPDKHAKSGWKDLRGDGWISNVYCMTGDKFEKHIVKHIDLNKKYPLIHIIWASPTWPFGAKGANPQTWWKQDGHKQFDHQLKICREYNIPVAFFATQPTPKGGVFWSWGATDPIVINEYRRLCGMAYEADLIPSELIGFRKANKEKIAWANAKIAECSYDFDLDANNNPKITISDPLAFHKNNMIVSESFFSTITHKIESGDELKEKRTRGLALRGHKGSVSKITVITKIDFKKPVVSFKCLIKGLSVKALGGNLKVSFSKNGINWEDTLDGKKLKLQSNRMQTIEIPSGTIANDKQAPNAFWIKCELINSSGLRTNISTRLETIKVEAVFAKGAFGVK